MAYPTARGVSLLLYLLPFTSHDLTILHITSEIPQRILKLTLGIFTSKVVYTIKDSVTNSGELLLKGASVISHLFGASDCGTFSLKERFEILTLWINVTPVMELQVEIEHLIGHYAIFILTTVYNH
jgi:hypothetical protein